MNTRTANAPLDENMCRQLLGTQHFGRVIVILDDDIDVVPVAYALKDVAIVLRAVTPQALPAGIDCLFEIDAAAGANQDGWQVTVTGRLDDADTADAEHLPAWLADGPDLLRLSIDRLSGRRLATTDEPGHKAKAQDWSGRDASDLIG